MPRVILQSNRCFTFLSIIAICIFGSLFFACQRSQTALAIKAAEIFLGALSSLAGASKDYQSNVSYAVSQAQKKLVPSEKIKIKLEEIASEWESNWQKVQTTDLEEKLKNVKKASDQYWTKLKQITISIRDGALRAREIEKNQEANKKWMIAYANAQKQVEKANALRNRGNDFHKVMLAAALRRQIAEYTETLNSIAADAVRLIKELEVVTAQGKAIIGDKN